MKRKWVAASLDNFTAKCELAFVLTQEKALSFHFKAIRKNIDYSKKQS